MKTATLKQSKKKTSRVKLFYKAIFSSITELKMFWLLCDFWKSVRGLVVRGEN